MAVKKKKKKKKRKKKTVTKPTGLNIKSPDGTKWTITIDNGGGIGAVKE